ncbi:MAG: acetyl-CoA decarbonylase/synthase complex subunit delta [Deltaproteobacteria bacterium]|nr:acetyl-CoA decarbonylase/synthase complex subunit delta [Deltaproteobacteria bacterium]
MAFQIPKQPYSGKIGTTTIGTGDRAVTLGGSEVYPFHFFEGKLGNPPRIAMEIWDYDPSKDWPAAALAPFKDVVASPEKWAKKCVEEYGADLVVVQLKSTDPNGLDRSPSEAAEVAVKVLKAVDVPVMFWGTANNQKDEEVLKQISEANQGKNVALSPVEEANHKALGANALAYGQIIVGSSPIDVNLAKQLNILLGNLGVPLNKLIVDPTSGGLGYGMEYSYSVIERIRMAALTQEDDKLQVPIVCNVGNEIWKCKEAGLAAGDAPALGDPERRAILMECVAAVCYLHAGADVVILRHPESVRLVRSFIQLMIEGGKALDVKGIAKRMPLEEMDLASIAPAPILGVPGGAEAPKAKAEKAKEPPKAAPKPEKKEEKPKAPVAKQEPKVVAMKPKPDEEAKAEAEQKAKAEAEQKAKAEAEQKAKAEAEKKAEEDAKKRAEEVASKEVEAKAREKDELEALRRKRGVRKSAPEPEKKQEEPKQKTRAAESATPIEKLIQNLDRIHRRV